MPAGLLQVDEHASTGVFRYGRRYLDNARALPIDPLNLALGPQRFTTSLNRGLFGVIRDASPDFWGRTVIAREARQAMEQFSEVDFLLASKASRVGNLAFGLNPRQPLDARREDEPGLLDIEQLLQAASDLEHERPVSQHIENLLVHGTSMGGARPKCAIIDGVDEWLAKFPAKGDTLDVPLIEYATMTLAAGAGLRVSETKIERVLGKHVLFVRRFDRRDNETLDVERIGYLSALSLMNRDERDRLFGYPDIAARLRSAPGMRREDLRELFSRMVFNAACRNTDDHARNHGFLVNEAGEVSLSPAFDILPTPSRAGIGTDFDLALEVGTQGRHVSLENLLSRAYEFALDPEQALAEVARIMDAVSTWESHFKACGVGSHDIEALRASFEGSLAKQWAAFKRSHGAPSPG